MAMNNTSSISSNSNILRISVDDVSPRNHHEPESVSHQSPHVTEHQPLSRSVLTTPAISAQRLKEIKEHRHATLNRLGIAIPHREINPELTYNLPAIGRHKTYAGRFPEKVPIQTESTPEPQTTPRGQAASSSATSSTILTTNTPTKPNNSPTVTQTSPLDAVAQLSSPNPGAVMRVGWNSFTTPQYAPQWTASTSITATAPAQPDKTFSPRSRPQSATSRPDSPQTPFSAVSSVASPQKSRKPYTTSNPTTSPHKAYPQTASTTSSQPISSYATTSSHSGPGSTQPIHPLARLATAVAAAKAGHNIPSASSGGTPLNLNSRLSHVLGTDEHRQFQNEAASNSSRVSTASRTQADYPHPSRSSTGNANISRTATARVHITQSAPTATATHSAAHTLHPQASPRSRDMSYSWHARGEGSSRTPAQDHEPPVSADDFEDEEASEVDIYPEIETLTPLQRSVLESLREACGSNLRKACSVPKSEFECSGPGPYSAAAAKQRGSVSRAHTQRLPSSSLSTRSNGSASASTASGIVPRTPQVPATTSVPVTARVGVAELEERLTRAKNLLKEMNTYE